jgi:D-arabinose 5-phosphate isomerase GutQ
VSQLGHTVNTVTLRSLQMARKQRRVISVVGSVLSSRALNADLVLRTRNWRECCKNSTHETTRLEIPQKPVRQSEIGVS